MMQRIFAGCIILLLLNSQQARAGDASNSEPARYLGVCDAEEGGYFQLNGTQTCLKMSGSVTYDVGAGDDVYTGDPLHGLDPTSGAAVDVATISQTDLGTLKTLISLDLAEPVDDSGGVTLSEAAVELGGLLVGASSSQFDVWLNSAGNVLSDDVVAYGPSFTHLISYTTAFENGLSAMIGVEQGEMRDDADFVIRKGVPHSVAGLRLEADQAEIATVIGYDPISEELAAKVRLDVEVNDVFSAFVMAGYRSGGGDPGYFGAWEGRYAAWGGFSLNVTEKVIFNSQAAYTDTGKYTVAASVDFALLPALLITSELAFTSFSTSTDERDHALGGLISIEREF